MRRPEWFWDWRARPFDKQAQEDKENDRALERLVTYLSADDTVLDYGCATGVVTCKIASRVVAAHGIDTSAGMIEVARENARDRRVPNVRFLQKAIFDDELERESYDVILAFNILHLLDDPRKAVRRASELLKPGGLFVPVTPCLGMAGWLARSLLPLIARVGILPYLRTFRVSDVEDMTRDGGFEIVESDVFEGAIPSSFVIARKR